MQPFDRTIAETHLNALLKQYKIKVRKWSSGSNGRANWNTREIQIPKPTNIDRFGVCMHEVGHIIDGNMVSKIRFVQEFNADMFKLEQVRLLGFDDTCIIDRIKWHSLSRIAMATNRGFKVDKIPANVKQYFSDIDFSTWEGKAVFVSYGKTFSDITIKISDKFSRTDVEKLLASKGMVLEMSEADDSTYGKWIVRNKGQRFGFTFDNLTEIGTAFSKGELCKEI